VPHIGKSLSCRFGAPGAWGDEGRVVEVDGLLAQEEHYFLLHVVSLVELGAVGRLVGHPKVLYILAVGEDEVLERGYVDYEAPLVSWMHSVPNHPQSYLLGIDHAVTGGVAVAVEGEGLGALVRVSIGSRLWVDRYLHGARLSLVPGYEHGLAGCEALADVLHRVIVDEVEVNTAEELRP
jgi:hypothetical protein